MKPCHLNAILLCAAMGLADFTLALHTDSTDSASFVVLAGLAFGQLTLLAAWSIAGSGPWVARVMASLAIATGLARLLAPATAAGWSGWSVALAAYWMVATAGMWLITATATSSRQEPQRFRRQYSLSSLMSVITLLSLALGLTHWVSLSLPQLASFAPIGLWLVIVAVVTMHSVSSAQRAWLLAPLATAFLAATILSRTTGLYYTGFFALLCLVEVMTITLGMLAVQSTKVVGRSANQPA